MRKCKVCGETKALIAENFRLKKSGFSGEPYHERTCSECHRAAERQWRRDNPVKAKAKDAANRASNREKKNARRRAWGLNNAQRHRETNKRWRDSHPIEVGLFRKRWRAARRNSQIGPITAAQILDLYVKQRGLCAICRKKLTEQHVDHIEPLAKGGAHVINNLQLLCPPCNVRKSDRHPIEHMQSLGFLL
jgi:5-methylcytosine-specific restriction endonuclease McrA